MTTGEVMAATGEHGQVSPPIGTDTEITIEANSIFERISNEESLTTLFDFDLRSVEARANIAGILRNIAETGFRAFLRALRRALLELLALCRGLLRLRLRLIALAVAERRHRGRRARAPRAEACGAAASRWADSWPETPKEKGRGD